MMKSFRLLAVSAVLSLGLWAGEALADCTGQFAAGAICNNATGSQAPPSGTVNPVIGTSTSVVTFAARVLTPASTTTRAGLNLPHGVAPSAPVNGDLWSTTAGFFGRVNGVTVGPFTGPSAGSFAGTSPITVSFPAGAVTYAFDFTVANTFLAQQTNQGATTTSPGWYAQITGDTVPRVRIGMNATDVPSIAFGPGNAVRDLFIERFGAANVRLGAPDAATAVAQTISVQNVVAGTTNGAGADLTIALSRGTGSGVGGGLIFQWANAGSSGTSQNSYQTAGKINSDGGWTIGGSPTGGSKGAGTINSSGLYINGTAVSLTAAGLTVGTSTITSGSTGRVLYDNGAVLGEYQVTGAAGAVVLSFSPTITTPIFTFGTGGASSITASSANTGFANNFLVQNVGTSSNSATQATSQASLTCVNCYTAMIASGGASPAGLIQTGSGMTGGLTISTGAANIVLTPAGGTVQVNSGGFQIAESTDSTTPFSVTAGGNARLNYTLDVSGNTILRTANSTNFLLGVNSTNLISMTTSGISINGLTITASSGTLTIANAKVATISNTLTFTGTDGSTLNVGTGGTLGTAAFQNTGTSGANIPFLNGNNTYSGSSTFSGTANFQSTFQIGGNTITWPGSATTVAALNIAGQTLTGGANVTSGNLGTQSSGTLTLNCGTVPLQFVTNNGAFTLAAPANDGSCIVRVTNGASAGAITFSGWTVGTNTGDSYATTNTNKYDLFVRRINGAASYQWSALQ